MQVSEEKWSAGMRVRLKHDPLRTGILTQAEPHIRNNRRRFQVQFSEGQVSYVPEDQLEPTEEPMSPLDLLARGSLGTHKDLRRTLTHVRLTGRLADIIYSMEATDTDFYAYQFKPVLKLLQTPTNSLLIADEVGMGKTIEAGLIWTELRSRFNLKRLVVLCPAALCEKWRDELTNKMGLSPEICDARNTLRILKDKQAHTRGFAIIASIQGLRPPRDWEDGEDSISDAAKLSRFLRESEDLIDLTVVDEAHHMRNPRTQNNRLGQLIRGVSSYLVLLTATPIHNYNQDLFSLLQLLDPDTFERDEDFRRLLDANEPLVRARDLVLKGVTLAKLTSVLSEAQNSHLLRGNRQLEALLNQLDETFASHMGRSRIAYSLENINLLAHTITRTRKRDVEEGRVVRDPTPEFIQMTEIERKFYSDVTDSIRDYAQEREINESFLLATPQRQMASCMPAALKSWKKRRVEIPEDQLSRTDQDDRRRAKLGPLTARLVDCSREFIDCEELADSDSKYVRLREILQGFFNKYPQDKVIVFSTFLGTLEYLKGRLDDDDISNIVLQGGGSRTKNDIIQEFRSSKGPNVMLSSEVGGEGVDLQFSWVVINYDLPWNPMRVEQRIGRVDRLGQESEKVLIWNLFYADTIDARIYKYLYEKLDLCRNALGDFEAILGEEINKLTHDILLGRLSPEEEKERINQTAQALEKRKHDEELLESEAVHLVAHGDYILNQVKAAYDMNRWINEMDLFAYVNDFLKGYYPGCELIARDGNNYEYDLSLTYEAKDALSKFMESNNLTGQTQLNLPSIKPVIVVFKNRPRSESPSRKETISQFHPLIRFISDRISKKEAQLRPAVSVRVSRRDIQESLKPGIYVLAASRWSIRGLRNVEKLTYEAVLLDQPETCIGEDVAELLAITCASKGKHWLEAESECDLEHVSHIANNNLFGTLEKRFGIYIEKEKAQNEDRADIQDRNLDRRFCKEKNAILRAITTLKEKKTPSQIPAHKGRLKKLKERYRTKKLNIKERRKLDYDNPEDICVSVVLIE